jgi:hypothetical protein
MSVLCTWCEKMSFIAKYVCRVRRLSDPLHVELLDDGEYYFVC